MFRTCLSKSSQFNYRYFCKEVIIVIDNKSNKSNKSIKPYEIAESEEIDTQKMEKLNSSKEKKLCKKTKWGNATIDME